MAWWVVLLEESGSTALVGTSTGRSRSTADLTLGGQVSWSGGWWGAVMDESGISGLVATSRGKTRVGGAARPGTVDLSIVIGSLTSTTRGRGRVTADLTVTGAPSTPWIDTGGPYGIPLYPPPLLQNLRGRGRATADLTNGHDVVLVATARGRTRGAPTNLSVSGAATPAQVTLAHSRTTTIETSTREANTVTLSHFPLR